MRDFNYVTFATKYSAYSEKGAQIHRMKTSACFSKVFQWLHGRNDRRHTIKYRIIIYRGINKCKREGISNACFLSHQELRNHIDQLKGIIPFKCRIKDVNDEAFPKFEVSVTVTEGTAIQHKYILAWIRYAYEYPYNVILLDCNKLRGEKEFKFISGFNLFNIVGQCLYTWRRVHSIAYGNIVKLEPKHILSERLENSYRLLELNDIFICDVSDKMDRLENPSKIKELTIYDVEYWRDDEIYIKERLPIYKKRLTYLRNI